MRRSSEVVEGLTLWLADLPGYPLAGVLSYTKADPYAVRLMFLSADGGETVDVTFGRALLTDGLQDPVGEGDVMVGPHEADGYLVITLRPEHGSPYALYGSRKRIAAFLNNAYRLVPMGREYEGVDVDAAIAALLRGVTP
ncbi:Streptomyces sporulation and cell division protein, SsgA [Streptosporangium subroseum]|uniref:Streptomyces sporulation and cell division protein, SsgA n=1 Tax=Streptosporangium subroseum TaxID=106412 RepID=A0A239P2N3_9ACTN|nr:SsgA family sporulation/cell division regulator [Streptosporangium subroseum]SNT60589.1 Streptomyces sporulation and cell division protein, SsgA [Streptosporangium subroseum]